MDVRHDWKALNEVLFQGQSPQAGASSVVMLEDQGRSVDGVVSNGRAFHDPGVPDLARSKDALDGLASKYEVDQAIVLSKRMLDQLVAEASGLGTNYFQQLQSLREGVMAELGRKRGGLIVSRRHFVLDLFGSKLRRILPRRFNVLVFVDLRPADAQAPLTYRALLLSYVGGQLDQFYEPDFSSLPDKRLENWHKESAAIGQYLENRYILPCYGLFMQHEEWRRCLDAATMGHKPWRRFVRSHDAGLAAVYPNGIFAKFLLAVQRLIVYFSRV